MESSDLDKALNECEQRPACLMSAHITNDKPPSFDVLAEQLPEGLGEEEALTFRN